jgi:hypothetical protein
MLFGEKSSNVTTLNQDEMKETSGKYWNTISFPYYYYTSYDYDNNSITNVFEIGETTAANQVTVVGGIFPSVSTTTVATPVINGGTTIINN